jgi:hypothetical protein
MASFHDRSSERSENQDCDSSSQQREDRPTAVRGGLRASLSQHDCGNGRLWAERGCPGRMTANAAWSIAGTRSSLPRSP